MKNKHTLENSKENLDKVGILCSGACAIHCIMTPIITLGSPAIASFFKSEWLHIGLLLLLIPVAIFAFLNGQKSHRKNRPFIIGIIGIIFLISAVVFESLLKIEIKYFETILTFIGCIFLIYAHFLNIRYLRQVYT